jgi:hypothetical protein
MRKTPSVTMQNSRSPVTLNVDGAELATKVVFKPPLANPAEKTWYPLLEPLESTLSIKQAVVDEGAHPVDGPPRLDRLAE